jgi:hypothetical protein
MSDDENNDPIPDQPAPVTAHDTIRITADVPSIRREELIECMASRILGEAAGYDDEGNEIPASDYWHRKRIGVRLREYLNKRLDEAIGAAVKAAFDELVTAKISAMIEVVIAEGWQQTDNYGRPTGRVAGLKDRISAILDRTDNHNNASFVTRTITDAVATTMRGELQPVIDKARADLKAKVDGAILDRLAQAMRAALGMTAG